MRPPLVAVSLVLMLAAAACGGSDSSPSPSPSTIALQRVADGLDAPVFATGAGDGSGRLFVAQQDGVVRVLRGGRIEDRPFLDLSARTSAGGERGLLGLAFAPGYGTGGEDRLYVHYTNLDGDTTLAEHRAPAGADAAVPATERVVLVEPQPFANHNGGWIGFDPSGMLLLALGDGGAGGDPGNRAEDRGELLGKLLRLDVLGTSTGYRIPSDNPFVGREGARPEILHLGLRNPWRASFDQATGDLWIGDVGQGSWEEIDVARAGASGLDFGWNSLEGTRCYDPAVLCTTDGKTPPVAEYGHDDGCSVVGGYVYRGAAVPVLAGRYLFSDYCSGTIWGLDAGVDGPQEPVTLRAGGGTIASFGQDDDGELYVLDAGTGEVLRIVAG